MQWFSGCGLGISSISKIWESSEMQIISPIRHLLNLTLGGWGPELRFNKLSRWFWSLLKFGNHWPHESTTFRPGIIALMGSVCGFKGARGNHPCREPWNSSENESCLLFYFSKILFIRERDGEHEQGEEQEEGDKQTPCSVRSPARGLTSQPWDHDLSPDQEADTQQTEPSRCPESWLLKEFSIQLGKLPHMKSRDSWQDNTSSNGHKLNCTAGYSSGGNHIAGLYLFEYDSTFALQTDN